METILTLNWNEFVAVFKARSHLNQIILALQEGIVIDLREYRAIDF